MLTVLRQVLQELGLVDGQARFRYYINITSGDAMSVSIFVDAQRFFQIKASEVNDLSAQYELYCQASRDLGAFVPRPLGYRDHKGWSVMVSEGVQHEMARPERAFQTGRGGVASLAQQLFDYFACAARCAGPVGLAVQPQGELLRGMHEHFQHTPWASAAQSCILRARALGVESIPAMPQHGDFVFNNLAWAAGKLVVFDWEDYRKVALPGLDIFTLVMSLLREDVGALRTMMDLHSPHVGPVERFVQLACEAQGLGVLVFRSLVPFYALIFLYLKRTYGSEVQERIAAVFMQLVPRAAALVAAPPPASAIEHSPV